MIVCSSFLQQLKGHIAELDDLRSQVKPAERDKFDSKTIAVKRDIVQATEEYGMVQLSMNLQSPDHGGLN